MISKRFLAVLLAAIMVLVMLPVTTAYAGATVVEYYDELIKALAAPGTQTIIIGKDIEKNIFDKGFYVTNVNGDKTLDLSGHEVIITNSYTIDNKVVAPNQTLFHLAKGASLEILDSHGDGYLQFRGWDDGDFGDYPYHQRTLFETEADSTLTIRSGKLEAGLYSNHWNLMEARYNVYLNTGTVVEAKSNSTVNVYGGTLISRTREGGVFLLSTGAKLNVYGGEIMANSSSACILYRNGWQDTDSVNIAGGRFKCDRIDYKALQKGVGVTYDMIQFTGIKAGQLDELQCTWTFNGKTVETSSEVTVKPRYATGFTETVRALETAYVGTDYSCDITGTVKYGPRPFTYELKEGALPKGLTLDGKTGVISGKPTAEGTFAFTVNTRDALNGPFAEKMSITVKEAPDMPLTITSQPESVKAVGGSIAEFAVAAAGGQEPYTYQWQSLSQIVWKNLVNNIDVDGAARNELLIHVGNGDDWTANAQLRCVVTDADGNEAISNTAALTYAESQTPAGPLAITSQPESVKAVGGSIAEFTVLAAGGKAPYTYQWQSFSQGVWQNLVNSVDVDGTAENELLIHVGNGNDWTTNVEFRCVIKDSDGAVVNTDSVKITLEENDRPVPVPASIPFTDVPKDAYYYDATVWAYNAKPQITDGNGKDKFMPEQICTRGQVVTFLWRSAGEPEPKSMSNPFTDVKSNDYFYKPVLWAVEQGITDGTTPSTFSPNNPCKNSHILTFIWRALGKPGDTGNAVWYQDAWDWAVKNHLLDGTYTGTFDINALCPRKNVVQYLYVYYNMK